MNDLTLRKQAELDRKEWENRQRDERKEMLTNAIKLVKDLKASWIRKGFNSNLDLLFYENGKNCKFGIDSCYLLQVRCEMFNVRTKTDVLNKLKDELIMLRMI